MMPGRWLPKCPTCGNEKGLSFIRGLDPTMRVYECRARQTEGKQGHGKAALCRTEFICKLQAPVGDIEGMILELRARIDGFIM